MRTGLSQRLRAILLVAVIGSTGGCGVELALIGAAASAASSGSAVYKRGKLNVSWMGSFDQVVAAGEAAGSELGLTIRKTDGDPDKGTWKTVMATADGDRVVVKTYRKTPQLTEFQIDVGWSGSESTARLVLKRMAVAIDIDASQDGSGQVPLIPLPPMPPPPEDTPVEPPAENVPDPDLPRTIPGDRL